MAKKQVAVSLRKPPSPEAIDAFVEGDAAPTTSAPPAPSASKRARRASTTKSERAVASEPSPAPPSVTPAPESAVVAVEARREAPAEAPPAEAAPPPAEAQPVVVGPRGAPLRPVTLYLPQELADRLAMHCIEHDRDASNVIGEALKGHLSPRLGAGSAQEPAEASAPPPSPREPHAWSAPPFPRVEWPPRRLEHIIELGRVLVGMVRRRGYAA
jgi:hypothetical protein